MENLYWQEVWDCENVSPLFNVPACVLIAKKMEVTKTTGSSYPFPGEILEGKLPRKNASLLEAEDKLSVTKTRFYLHTRGKRSFWATEKGTTIQQQSYYKDKFAQGAIIVPRSFWFVEVKSSLIGINPDLPPLETAERAKKEAKSPYQGLIMKGTVESRFLYATLLSSDLLPFGHLDYRLVVLPIEPVNDHYKLIDADEARKRGFVHLAQWLEKVEREWEKRRTTKAKNFTVLQWLDYRKNLTNQNPNAKYRVIYPDVQRVAIAGISKSDYLTIQINKQVIKVRNMIVDTTTYSYDTNSLDEACYLAACLNSGTIDEKLSLLRRRMQKTHPHVHKKIFDVAPIPKFDPKNPRHQRLVQLGEMCTEKVKQWLESGNATGIKSIGRLRAKVRQLLASELAEIDDLVKGLLG